MFRSDLDLCQARIKLGPDLLSLLNFSGMEVRCAGITSFFIHVLLKALYQHDVHKTSLLQNSQRIPVFLWLEDDKQLNIWKDAIRSSKKVFQSMNWWVKATMCRILCEKISFQIILILNDKFLIVFIVHQGIVLIKIKIKINCNYCLQMSKKYEKNPITFSQTPM